MFSKIEEAIEDIRLGKMIIVMDDEDRENEGDFVMAAEKVKPEDINFMAKHGKGLICVPITKERASSLGLGMMQNNNSSLHSTAFTESVDAVGSGTGISAQSRALTINKIVDKSTRSEELLKPGHIFPLVGCNGGVLKRAGHTEAAIDFSRLAGLDESGVICEILDDDGTMARGSSIERISKEFNIKVVTIKDLISYRRKSEELVKVESTINFPTKYGDFKLSVHRSLINNNEYHLSLVKGEITKDEPTMVRVHSECLTGDVFGSNRCDCGEQLDSALKIISEKGKGVLLYMKQEGRGIGLINKIKAYELQDEGYNTVEANIKLGFKADLRDYGIGAQILHSLNVRDIELLTNNPKKIVGLEGYNLRVVKRVPIEIKPNLDNINYMETKRDLMGHMILN